MLDMIACMDGKIANFPGGVLITCARSGTKKVLGAVGVSGATGDQDEHLALQAIKETFAESNELDLIKLDPSVSALGDDLKTEELKKYIL